MTMNECPTRTRWSSGWVSCSCEGEPHFPRALPLQVAAGCTAQRVVSLLDGTERLVCYCPDRRHQQSYDENAR